MRYIAITGVALFSLLLGTIVGYYANIEVPEIVIHWPDRKANEYSPSYNGETGDEVAFIFIGSSKCQYANDKRVNRIVRWAKLHLSRLINEKGLSSSNRWLRAAWSSQAILPSYCFGAPGPSFGGPLYRCRKFASERSRVMRSPPSPVTVSITFCFA